MRCLELLEGDLILPERDEPHASGRRPGGSRAELGRNSGVRLQQSGNRCRTRVADEAKRLRQTNVGNVDGYDRHRSSSVSITAAADAPDSTVTVAVSHTSRSSSASSWKHPPFGQQRMMPNRSASGTARSGRILGRFCLLALGGVPATTDAFVVGKHAPTLRD